ncbi:MAG: ribonuclease P protein component [Dehalococcoidia bacterium]|nr:ribonuclease P protein component [Dehalococcoidia bacterium]
MRTGRRARHAFLTAVARRTHGPTTRLGFAVSRRVGGAVVRNRLKRQLRMITRGLRWQSGYDVVIVPQPQCAGARFDEIAHAIASTCEKIGVLMVLSETGAP